MTLSVSRKSCARRAWWELVAGVVELEAAGAGELRVLEKMRDNMEPRCAYPSVSAIRTRDSIFRRIWISSLS